MKTKNILKIAIFSIALFALLISPILKSNSFQVEAETPPISISTYCLSNVAMDVLDINDASIAAEYIEKCCNTEYEWGAASQSIIDNECQKAQATIDSATQSSPSTGSYWGGFTPELHKEIQEIKVELQEERADDLCKISFKDAKTKCNADNKGYFEEQECKMQAFFTYQWCQIVKGVIEGLGKMFGGIISLEIKWILGALNPQTYGGLATNKGVVAIWTILRNIVNSLLVLGLIGIAIATILGYKKYAWKQILWKLILVALLVNFSLVISGIVVDTSNYLAGYFLSISQDNGSIAPRIMEGYGYVATTTPGVIDQYDPPGIFGDDKYKTPEIVGAEKPEEIESYSLRFGNFFIISFVMILVGGFAVIALLAIFLTVVVRNLFLIMLLGLSPIVFAAWIFPDTEKYWKMWWKQFIKWCLFPAIFAFTLFLALTVMNNMPAIGTESSMAVTIIHMTLLSMFLVGGLIFSIQSGGVVSKTVLQQSSKIGAAAGAFVGYKALKGATSSETWRKAQKKLEGSKFAPTHDIGVWMGEQPRKIRATELKQIEEDYKRRAPDQIRADMQLHKADKGRVALGLNTLAEKESLDYKKDDKFIEIAQNQPSLNVSGIKKVHPELYAEYFTKTEDMNKAIEQIEQISPGITRDQAKKRAVTNLTAEQLLRSSPDNIKSGNWENILERLEEKGTEHTNQFFHTLLDRNLPAENFAAMIRSTDDTEKRTESMERLIESVKEKIHGTRIDAAKHLKAKGYYKNKFLKEYLPELSES